MGAGLTYMNKASGDNGSATYGLDTLQVRGAKSNGPVEVYWDDDLVANAFYLLDMKNLHLYQSSIEFMKVRMPGDVDSGLNLYSIQNGGVFSAYIFGSTLRRTSGGWTNLTV
jgi:hypothetical protein